MSNWHYHIMCMADGCTKRSESEWPNQVPMNHVIDTMGFYRVKHTRKDGRVVMISVCRDCFATGKFEKFDEA
jgi:hypothetical protein